MKKFTAGMLLCLLLSLCARAQKAGPAEGSVKAAFHDRSRALVELRHKVPTEYKDIQGWKIPLYLRQWLRCRR